MLFRITSTKRIYQWIYKYDISYHSIYFKFEIYIKKSNVARPLLTLSYLIRFYLFIRNKRLISFLIIIKKNSFLSGFFLCIYHAQFHLLPPKSRFHGFGWTHLQFPKCPYIHFAFFFFNFPTNNCLCLCLSFDLISAEKKRKENGNRESGTVHATHGNCERKRHEDRGRSQRFQIRQVRRRCFCSVQVFSQRQGFSLSPFFFLKKKINFWWENDYQEIRQLCSYLLDLKRASAEEMRKSVYANYSAFIR